MKRQCGKRSAGSLASLLLLMMFAIGVVGVLLNGASVYKRLVERDAAFSDLRTCAQYIGVRIRQAASQDISVLSDFGDGDCLLICEQIGDTEYRTQVYCHDGWLMELFAAADVGLVPGSGEKILPIEHLSIQQNGNLLFFTVTDQNNQKTAFVQALRGCKREAS